MLSNSKKTKKKGKSKLSQNFQMSYFLKLFCEATVIDTSLLMKKFLSNCDQI